MNDDDLLSIHQIGRMLNNKERGGPFEHAVRLPDPVDGRPFDLKSLEEPANKLMEHREQQGLQQALVSDAALARDLALFGSTHLDQIKEAYDLSDEDLEERKESVAFKTAYLQTRNDIEKDRHGMLRARAASYLEVLLERIYKSAMHHEATLSQQLNTAKFMATVADAIPKGLGADGTVTGGSSVAVTFVTGNSNPLIKDVSSLDNRG